LRRLRKDLKRVGMVVMREMERMIGSCSFRNSLGCLS
jgi:hypothetical protein